MVWQGTQAGERRPRMAEGSRGWFGRGIDSGIAGKGWEARAEVEDMVWQDNADR